MLFTTSFRRFEIDWNDVFEWLLALSHAFDLGCIGLALTTHEELDATTCWADLPKLLVDFSELQILHLCCMLVPFYIIQIFTFCNRKPIPGFFFADSVDQLSLDILFWYWSIHKVRMRRYTWGHCSILADFFWRLDSRLRLYNDGKETLLTNVVLLVTLNNVVDQWTVFWQEHACNLKWLPVPHFRGPNLNIFLRTLFLFHLRRLKSNFGADTKVRHHVQNNLFKHSVLRKLLEHIAYSV